MAKHHFNVRNCSTDSRPIWAWVPSRCLSGLHGLSVTWEVEGCQVSLVLLLGIHGLSVTWKVEGGQVSLVLHVGPRSACAITGAMMSSSIGCMEVTVVYSSDVTSADRLHVETLCSLVSNCRSSPSVAKSEHVIRYQLLADRPCCVDLWVNMLSRAFAGLWAGVKI